MDCRYGNLFKTHIFGHPTVISIDPEANRYILLNEGKGIVPGYPLAMRNIIGSKNIAAVHGSTHKYIRGSLLSLIGPPVVKDHLLQDVDRLMRSFLHNWDGKTIDIQDMTNEVYNFYYMYVTGIYSKVMASIKLILVLRMLIGFKF